MEKKQRTPSFGYRILKSTTFVLVSDYIVYAVNFIRGIILARLLTPEVFGVMALAEFFRSLFGQPAGIGFDQALIQRRENVEVAYNGYYLIINGLTLAAFMLTLGFRNLFLAHYDPQVYSVLVVLMGLLFFQTLGSTHITYLRKNLAFGRISIIVIASSLLAFGISVYGALQGWGVWSLVSIGAVTTVTITVLGWILSPWRFEWRFDWSVSRSILAFGGVILVGNFFAFLTSQFDDFLVGQFTSMAMLGYYTKAYGLAQQPLALFSQVINKVAGPLIAEIQHDTSKLSRSFNLTVGFVFKGSLLMGLILFLWTPEIVTLLIGDQWLPMVPLLRGLMVYLITQPVWELAGSLFTFIGKPKIFVFGQAIQAVLLMVCGWIIVQQTGAWGISILVSSIVVVITFLFFLHASRYVRIDWWNVFLAPIIATVIAGLISYPLVSMLTAMSIAFWISVALIPTTLFLLSLFLLQKKSIQSDVMLLREVIRKNR